MANYVPALQSGIQGLSNAVKRVAVENKAFAEELAFVHNIRSEITPKSLRYMVGDMFESTGKMTSKTKRRLAAEIQGLGLPKNATWDEVLKAVLESKLNLLAPAKLPEALSPIKKELPQCRLKDLEAELDALTKRMKISCPPNMFAKLEELIKNLPKKYNI